MYARHAVPHLWVFDPDAITATAESLVDSDYVITAGGQGRAGSFSAPPFSDLPIDVGEIWQGF